MCTRPTIPAVRYALDSGLMGRAIGTITIITRKIGPSMRRPVSVKSVFLLPSCGFLEFEPSRLCRHPSIRTLLGSDFLSVQVRRSHFSRCCYLIIDLGSHLFDRSWARH